ncbi:metallophosphoesterase [Bosea sp. AAP35]|uniref:metallophosphoesterase n=1 Tax=Bosea sp. AAP35 TaxID=1523417 RepID=UPI0006B956E2|nr:metallophosphoesterase [Bosea sp. AAP35]KPF62858.1 metallophosphoesterase [Bosea sp. AAP35]
MFDRRRVLKTLAGLFFAFAGPGAYAAAWEPTRHGVTRYRLTPRGWPAGQTLRLVVISDLHIGSLHVPLSRVTEIVDAANALKPDMTLLLGDFVASRKRWASDPAMQAWAAELGRLQARDGVFAILGNHDWWHDPQTQARRAGPTLVGQALEEAGIPVLENRAVKIATAGGPIWLAGLGDQIAFLPRRRGMKHGIDDLAGTMAQITDDDAPVIMMAHEPDVFARMPDRVALTLSGHTHGGQVRLLGWAPIVPSRYGNRYAYGHVHEDGRDLIVSAGIGTSQLPIRFGIPPETLLVELG